VLFGSRARGQAGKDSDYDVAVFLNGLTEDDLAQRWHELDRLADLRSKILSDTDVFNRRQTIPRWVTVRSSRQARISSRSSACAAVDDRRRWLRRPA
jgi:predicted nucleotidyltransferase